MQFLRREWRTEARVLASTAVAVTATMAAQLTISFVETLAVARLGTAVLAGVTLALGVHLLVFLSALGVVTAVTPLAAQAHGRGDREEVCRIGQQGLLVGLAVSVPFAVLLLGAGTWLAARPGAGPEAVSAGLYLLGAAWGLPAWVCYVSVRCLAIAVGRVRVTTAIMAGAVPVHAVLTWWLVFGGAGLPPLGAFGAGLAYALAAVAAWMLLVLLARTTPADTISRVIRAPLRWDRGCCRTIVSLGLPFACRIVLREGVLPAAALLLAPFGPGAVGSHAVAARVLDLLGTCCFGFGDAANARVGASVGAGAGYRAGFIGGVAVQLSVAVAALFAGAVLLAPRAVASLILDTTDAVAVADAAVLLPFAAGLLVLESVQSALGGALSGMRDAKGPLVIGILGAWCLGLPVGVALAWTTGMPAQGVWSGLVLGGCMTTVLYGVRFRSRLNGIRAEGVPGKPASARGRQAGITARRRG